MGDLALTIIEAARRTNSLNALFSPPPTRPKEKESHLDHEQRHWNYDGEPVVLIGLIRTEDDRIAGGMNLPPGLGLPGM